MKNAKLLSLLLAVLVVVLCACAPAGQQSGQTETTDQPSPSVQASQEAQIQTGGEETLPEEVPETEEESPAVSPEETQSETAETTPASITGKPSEVAIEGLQLKDDVKRGEEYATVTLYDNGEYEYFGMDESVMVGLTVERRLPGKTLQQRIEEAGDAADFAVEQDEALTEQLGVPVERAEYRTGGNEDTRTVTDLLVHADGWDFRCTLSVPVDFVEDCQGVVDELFASLRLEE